MGFLMKNGVPYGAGIMPITIEGTLVANATSISFTNDAILEGERYNIYAWDKPTVKPTNIVVSGHTLTLTYRAQSTDTRIKVVIDENVNTLMFDDTNKADKSDLTDIFATGTTNTTGATITKGKYFYLDGVLVRALANIANNASFTLNTNYKVVGDGALNELSTAKTYYATGKIASGYESASVFAGHGYASVELHPDHTCEVRFTFTVTNTDTQNTYHGGISLTEIKTRNPNIPDIAPITGGFLVMVDTNGVIPAETSTTGTSSTKNGYGMFCQSIPSLYPGYWLFARVYKTDGSTGAWASSHFPIGTRLFGVALGTW